MPLQLFLNDLSSPAQVLQHSEAVRFLKGIVSVVRSACAIDRGTVLNCNHPISSLALGSMFTVAAIRNSSDCVEESLFLKTIQSRAPLHPAVTGVSSFDISGVEYKLPHDCPVQPGVLAEALGLSHLLKWLSISFPSHPHWQNTTMLLDKSELKDDGSIENTSVWARNACTSEDVAAHCETLKQLNLPSFRDGRDLWDCRSTLFPNLRFIPRTRDQVVAIQGGDPILISVSGKLFGIERAIDVWRRSASARPVFAFNVRPESRSRMGLVWFNDNRGVLRAFSDHTDFSPGEGRLHFIVETEPDRHALIGHVGRKLGIG